MIPFKLEDFRLNSIKVKSNSFFYKLQELFLFFLKNQLIVHIICLACLVCLANTYVLPLCLAS